MKSDAIHMPYGAPIYKNLTYGCCEVLGRFHTLEITHVLKTFCLGISCWDLCSISQSETKGTVLGTFVARSHIWITFWSLIEHHRLWESYIWAECFQAVCPDDFFWDCYPGGSELFLAHGSSLSSAAPHLVGSFYLRWQYERRGWGTMSLSTCFLN